MEYGAATFINKDTGKVITTLNSVSPAEIEVSSNYEYQEPIHLGI
jgi:uncharacterized membrane protein YukC